MGALLGVPKGQFGFYHALLGFPRNKPPAYFLPTKFPTVTLAKTREKTPNYELNFKNVF